MEHRPKTPNLKHGPYSDAIRDRFKDGRTREAKQLRKKLNSLIAEAGGPNQLSPAMWDYIGRIRNALNSFILAENWIKKQPIDSLTNEDGKLHRAFRSYLAAEKRYGKVVSEFRSLIREDHVSK